MTAKLRKIPLRKTTLKIRKADGSENIFDYREHLLGALNAPEMDERSGNPRGLGPVEMRRRLEVIGQIEAAKDDYVLLDSSDYNELLSCVKRQKWLLVDQAIVDFSDAVEKAEEVAAEEKKPAEV